MTSRMNDLESRIVTWGELSKSNRLLTGQIIESVLREIELADRDRQEKEDARSIRRNFNRLIGLVAALGISLILVWLFQNNLPTPYLAKTLNPYVFAAAITLDTAIVAWAYFKRI